MKRTRTFLSLVAAGTMTLGGCASIVGEREQAITINSTPDHANITITDERDQAIFEGTTPTSVTLKKADGSYFGGKDYVVTISKEGFESRSIDIESHPNGWYVGGNLLFGGLIGWQEDLDKSPFENIETHPFRIHHLAKTHRYQKDYDFFYKLSSKLIHPSAYKVFGVDDFSTQYEVVSMVGYHFICKATDFAVDFYNNNVVTSTPYV